MRIRLPFFLSLCFIILPAAPLLAQIQGVVKDASTFETIPNVNILVVDTKQGTSTNEIGFFELKRQEFPFRIQLSVVGFETRFFTIYEPQKNLIVYLKPSTLGLDEITISQGRIENPITQSTTISRSTVNLAQLSDKSATTAVELLRAETGVFIQQTSIGQGSIYVRGRAGRDVLYLFNGFRMNPSFVRSGQNQYFGVVDPFLIQKIDVYRGPVSIYYGSDALSGGVNVSPLVKDYSESDTLSGELYSAFNFNGNGEKTIHGKGAYQAEKFSLFVGASYRDFDFYKMSSESNKDLWFPYDESLSNADYNFQSLQASSKIKTGANSDITLVSYYGEIPGAPRLDRVTLGYAIEEDNPPSTPRQAYDSNTEPLMFWGNTAEFNTSLNSSIAESFNFKLGYFRLKDHRKTQDFSSTDKPNYSIKGVSDYTFSRSDTIEYDRNTSNQLLAAFDFQSSISEDMMLEWGADFSYDITSSENFTNIHESSLSRYPDGSKFMLGGLFVQLDQQIGVKLNLEYGGRYSFTYANIPFEGTGTARPFSTYKDGNSQLTGSFGLSYSVSSFLNLVSNISSGFRAPNVADLSEVGDRGSNLFQTTNTSLKPEKTINYDAGFRYDNGKMNTEFVAFWLHYFDKIDRAETGAIVDENGAFVRNGTSTTNPSEFVEVNNQNANSMDLLGIEFRGDYSLTSQINSGLTFTYTWGELTNTDGSKEPVNRVPPANGLVYLEYSPDPGISVRPQIRYAFAHRRISPDEIDDIRVSKSGTDGFANFQLVMNFETNENLHFKVLADNLTNTAYREHASSLDGLGRNYTLSVSYHF